MTHTSGMALLLGLWGAAPPDSTPSTGEDTLGLQLGVAGAWAPSGAVSTPYARAQLRLPVNSDSAMLLGLGLDLGTDRQTLTWENDTPLTIDGHWTVRNTQLSLRPALAFRSSPQRPLQGELAFGVVAVLDRERWRATDGSERLTDSAVQTQTFIAPSAQAALLYALGPGRVELGASVDLHGDGLGGYVPMGSAHLGYRWVL